MALVNYCNVSTYNPSLTIFVIINPTDSAPLIIKSMRE